MVQVRCLVESDSPQKHVQRSPGHFEEVGGQFVFLSEEQDFQHQHLANTLKEYWCDLFLAKRWAKGSVKWLYVGRVLHTYRWDSRDICIVVECFLLYHLCSWSKKIIECSLAWISRALGSKSVPIKYLVPCVCPKQWPKEVSESIHQHGKRFFFWFWYEQTVNWKVASLDQSTRMYIESKSSCFLVLWLLFVGKFQLMGERFFLKRLKKSPIRFLSYPRCFTNLKFFLVQISPCGRFPFKGPGC